MKKCASPMRLDASVAFLRAAQLVLMGLERLPEMGSSLPGFCTERLITYSIEGHELKNGTFDATK
jgi:hypothetical protein